LDSAHHAGKRALLRGFGQGLFRHQQAVVHGARQPRTQRLRLLFDFLS
jgi:hypothetical protein